MGKDDSAAVLTRQSAREKTGPEAVSATKSVGRWFCDKGCLLYIDDQGRTEDSEVQPLLDALLLDEHDELLRCVDACLSRAHDWQPVESVDPMPSLQVSLCLLSEPSKCISLVLAPPVEGDAPGHSLSAGGRRMALPAEWQSLVDIRYQEHSASLVLDAVALGAGDAARLVPGALVVLPASFEAQWPVRLQSIESEQATGLNARLDPDTRVLAIAPALDALAGWQANASDTSGDTEVESSGVTANMAHPGSGDGACVEDADKDPVAASALQRLLVVAQTPVIINAPACDNAWRMGGDRQLGPLEALNGLRVSVSLHNGGKPGSEAKTCSDAGSRVLSGTLISIGRGFGVILDLDPPVDGSC